jgi:putative ABC transport system permease protein
MKGQVLTVALVVASATGGFVGSLGTYHALQEARAAFYAHYRFANVFVDVKRAPRAVLQRVAALPGVVDSEANTLADSQLFLPDVPEPLIAHLVGIPTKTGPRLNQLYIRKGRMIEPGAALEGLVDEGFAAARHLRPGDEVGVLLNGIRQHIRIVGVGLSPEYINPSIGGAFPDPKGVGVFWIDGERLADSFDLKEAFNHLNVVTASSVSESQILNDLDVLLHPYGGRGAYGRRDQMSDRIVSQEMNQQRVLGTVMPSLFVWVAAFLLNVVLGRQIATQREQVAALKALGFGNAAIAFYYLQFVAIVVACGIGLGIGVGAWFGSYMTGIYADFFHFPAVSFKVEPALIAAAAGACIAAGFGGALFAIQRIIKLSPAQAMRPPTPSRYRPLLLERLKIAQLIPTGGRMILRNLERRPVRSALAAVGVAAAVALIISGTFWWDAIGYMIDVQFNSADRSDAVITFAEPRSRAVGFDVRRLPGVMQAESYRTVGVRFRSAHRIYRTAIMGLGEQSGLRRVLDGRHQPVDMPGEGVLLSDRLAQKLEVRAGDFVQAEMLEGARIRRNVRVAGVVDDMFALMGYMDLDALNRLMDEAVSISAVNARLDRARQNDLFARIKAMPAVAMISIKENSLASFRETSARNVLVFTSVFTLFAATIAVGVVYNSARVSLAERAWELASLRVLGFSRGEVSTFLLGELAVEVGAGILIGLWLGRRLGAMLAGMMHSDTFRIPVIIAPKTYVIAILTTMVSGVLSALIVRRRIDRLDLVAVLKTRE